MIRTILTVATLTGMVSACGTTETSEDQQATTTTRPYTRVTLTNPCDAIPAELFTQQELKKQSVSLYPDNDQSLPNSSSNGCWVETSTPARFFSLAITNRDFDWVRRQYSGMAKTDRTELSKSFEGKQAEVSDLEGRSCMILIGVQGGTLKMEGIFTADPSADNCAHGVELAKLFLPYIKVA